MLQNILICGCTNLTNIEIPANVTSIGAYAFQDCSSLENIEIPAKVETIGVYAFSGCTNLANKKTNGTLIIPKSVTTLGSNAFNNCPLESFEVQGNSKYSVVDGMLVGGSKLIQCPAGKVFENGRLEMPLEITEIAGYAFKGCTGLEELIFAEDSSITKIPIFAFSGCTGLTRVTIP